jgi:hypothetical protein
MSTQTSDPHDRIAHLEQLVRSLLCRVEALEQPAQAEPLAQRNAEAHARGERLRAVIRQLLEQHPGPRRGAAKRIYHVLETDAGRAELPSVRTIQHHITQIRKAAALHV